MVMMKKININYKLALLIIASIIIQCSFYSFGKLFTENAYLIGSSFDTKTPFISFFVYFYFIWYFMLFLVPYIMATYDKRAYTKYTLSCVISCFIAGIIFIIYPTKIVRYVGDLTGLSGYLVSFIYSMDDATCCLPSLHVLLATLFTIGSFNSKCPKYVKITTLILSLLITLSTLFIKQHVLVDAISAVIIAIIVYFIVCKTHIYEKVLKRVEKIIS